MLFPRQADAAIVPLGRETDTIGNYLQHSFRSRITAFSTGKKGFICIRTDDTPRVDLEWVKLLNKYGLRYTICANVPYYNGTDISIIKAIQQMGHEICDHTNFHTTFRAHVPEKDMALFDRYIGSGDIVRTQDYTLHGVPGKLITLKTHVGEVYSEHKFGGDRAFKLAAGDFRVRGNFTGIPGDKSPLVYIDNAKGDKIGWILASKENDSTIILSNNDGTYPRAVEDEFINMYAVAPTVYNYTLTEGATYCLLLAGQCWFNQTGLKKPLTWNQPGGYMPFVDRNHLAKALGRLGMVGGIADQTASDGAQPTYAYASPYPTVSYRWDGGFDQADGTEEYLQRLKEHISDCVATRSIRTLGGHFLYDKFPGETDEIKRKNWLEWFDRLFCWISEQKIECLTVEEMLLTLEYAQTNPAANVFPELYYDRAGRGKPDGYVIDTTRVKWVTGGRPESKNKALSISGNGEMFRVNNLGALEKGANELSFYVKSNQAGARVHVKTSMGLSVPNWNPEKYEDTGHSFEVTKAGAWQRFVVPLTIPYDMNYINISFEVDKNKSATTMVSGMSLKGI